jgi:hypothetical protein
MNTAMGKVIDQSKKVITGFLLLGISALATAQSGNDPEWHVSKGVQKVANKKSFEDEIVRASYITPVTLDRSWMVSKGVHNLGKNNGVGVGNVASHGIQEWTISKGVQRIQHKKRFDAPVPVKKEEQITKLSE